MTNVGGPVCKLVSRHWVILDSDGKKEEVRGKGVVGDYPKLAVGESYSYVSYCPIATTWGTMEGSYTFEREDGTRLQVGIGRFFLVPTAPPLPLATQPHRVSRRGRAERSLRLPRPVALARFASCPRSCSANRRFPSRPSSR